MKKSEFVEACIERLEEKGWHQGGFFKIPWGDYATVNLERPNDYPGCAIGTMCDIMNRNLEAGRIYSEVISDLEARVPVSTMPGYKHIPTWNDHPLRTKEEVIDKFMELAKDYRNRGE